MQNGFGTAESSCRLVEVVPADSHLKYKGLICSVNLMRENEDNLVR